MGYLSLHYSSLPTDKMILRLSMLILEQTCHLSSSIPNPQDSDQLLTTSATAQLANEMNPENVKMYSCLSLSQFLSRRKGAKVLKLQF